MATDTQPILGYAPAPRSCLGRIHRLIYPLRKWLICITLAGVLIAWGPDLYRGLRQHYYRRQMLSHTEPAERVACSESASWGGRVGGFVAVTSDPVCLVLANDTGGASNVVAAASEPTLLLHARTTRAGVTRLIHIRRRSPLRRESWDAPIAFSITLTTPRLLPFQTWPAVEQAHEEVIPQVYDDDVLKSAIRIFAGQPDPTNTSRFTIPYIVEDTPGVIEGFLLDPDPGETEPRVVLKRKM